MEIKRDFKELLEYLNSRNVEYLLVGAYAMAFHGVPRNTGDMHIWVGPGHKNAERLLMALDDFGFGSLGLNVQDFIEPDRVIQLGIVPSRVDLLTSISGVAWPDAWVNKQSARYASVPVYILSRESFL